MRLKVIDHNCPGNVMIGRNFFRVLKFMRMH